MNIPELEKTGSHFCPILVPTGPACAS